MCPLATCFHSQQQTLAEDEEVAGQSWVGAQLAIIKREMGLVLRDQGDVLRGQDKRPEAQNAYQRAKELVDECHSRPD